MRSHLPGWRGFAPVWLLSGLILLALAMAFPPEMQAQRITARIVGIITDASGAVVPGVNITATNRGTGLTFKAVTNAEGYYVLTQLPVGEYSLLVEARGFRRLERSGINLALDQTSKVDLQLQVGEVAETVTITGEAPLINTENVAINVGVDRKQITELPISFVGARSIMDFMLVGSGITTSQSGGPYENNNYAINGSPQNTQSASVDGTSIAVPGGNMWYLIRPPVEEVREVKIQSGTFSPEAGGFAAINMGTVSGSNEFHGTGFFYYQNEDLTARSYFQATKPPFQRKEGGWTVTGPVIKGRTFFAYSYDGYWSNKPQSPIVTVPTDQLRSGNFQGVGNIFDPATTRPNPNGAGYVRDPFPNNQIPAERMDPVALKLLEYWPQPNIPNSVVNNYNSQLIGQDFEQTMPNTAIKIDQKVTDSNQFFARYQHMGGGWTGEATFPGIGDYTGLRRQSPGNVVTFGDTHIFSPRLVNEFRFGFLRISTATQHYKAEGQNVPEKIGLKNVSPSQFPLVSVGGALSLVLGPRDGQNRDITENYQWSNNLTYIRGAHIVKAGGGYMLGSVNPYSLGRPSGQFSFSGIFTNQPQVAGAAMGFADFLLGLPSSTTLSEGRRFGFRQPSFSLFVSDDIKLRRNLTLNLGLRFDRTWGVNEINNWITNFNPTVINPSAGRPGAVVFAGRDGAPDRFSEPTNNLSPRIGLAYTLKSKTVFRAGYSINYYANPISVLQPMTLGFVPSNTLATTDQITPLVRLRDGPPALNTNLNLKGDIANNQNVTWIPNKIPSLAYYQWSFSVQRELPLKLFADAAYVGSRGVHLWFQKNMNEVPWALLGPGDAQSRRPFPQYQGITMRDNDGFSKYHALQMTLSRRMADGLVFMANYTISKTMDNSSWDIGGGGAGAPYVTRFDLRREWALSDHDSPQVFNLTAVYEVPQWIPGGIGKYLAKGWQLNAVAHVISGQPLNPGVSVDQRGSLGGTQRPNRTGNGTLSSSERSTKRWFDTSAFSLPAPYTFGNSGRNVLRRPSYRQADFSVFKNTYFKTPLNENTNAQLRLEFFNVLNHVTFNPPNATIGSLAAGTITNARYPRSITLGMRFVF